ncbi:MULTISPECIES: GNAT family N-acetyltransferase [Sphingobacterium]|uniref:GNAT family N-acetyltransferase n=1 Tax=Sphingobacterium TaxID=28453 RepID=UPI00289DD6DA|nr:GNAT family N-acetyltransferase [Sphingobacterium mizutaii]
MTEIRQANIEDASLIHDLAHAIWYPTYENILSKKQIDFMLDKMYSVEVLSTAIQNNTAFHLLYEEKNAVGFIGIVPKGELLRIEKIYLLPSTQGKGYGKQLIDYAAQEAKKLGLDTLELNVNRSNNAYQFYLKQGFEVIQEVDIPYYEFTLDDYVMRKKLD